MTMTSAPTVAEARAALDQLLARADDGDDVTGAEIAAAQGTLAAAEARAVGDERRAAEAAEAHRLASIAHLVESLRAGDYATQRRAVADAFDTAVAALVDLHTAAEAHDAGVRAVVTELRRLAPLPDDAPVAVADMASGVGYWFDGTLRAAGFNTARALPSQALLEAAGAAAKAAGIAATHVAVIDDAFVAGARGDGMVARLHR